MPQKDYQRITNEAANRLKNLKYKLRCSLMNDGSRDAYSEKGRNHGKILDEIHKLEQELPKLKWKITREDIIYELKQATKNGASVEHHRKLHEKLSHHDTKHPH
ncbi:unnamed protein product [marine sediment metagenome]|uniref:Uncharacterized protein n=1 Tax=marine sediment metagenome TaxID=412755 RepID=X1HMH3_9ZZZZ